MACDLNLGDDQRQILAAAGSMLEAHYHVPRRRSRQHDDLGALAAFGLLGVALPDAGGEAGYSVVEEALLHVLLGRHLVSTGALAATVGARLAAQSGRTDLAVRLAENGIGICAAVPADSSILLLERGEANLALVTGDRELAILDLEGIQTSQIESLGHGIPMQRLASGDRREIAKSNDCGLLDTANLLISAQLLGIAEAARDLAVAYAGVRQQFGQPIGGFQAIKHHCAKMAMAAEMASAQLDMAAIGLRDGHPDASFQIAALRRLAQQAALFNTRTSIQVHGGIGFSAEADVHHYLKQAHVLSRLGAAGDILAMEAPMSPYRPLAGAK